ncbi:hypothetical protein BZA05DRAFT_207095 [Tricharina praecox]|uniref:uncharacterized protein n=1 Tax=Tricharina praecox TaxID=43433 RepID=UPI00221F1FA8|nr:uncharacterized protein BZA05DRAFT_207095 [Tricharina praecox]KAI5842063.1 hypothetical protein BZA05DRAFT_207095 [Tricharina praecox]
MRSNTLLSAALLVFGATFPAVTVGYNISSIAIDTRTGWCNAQVAQCPALCADQKEGLTDKENDCFPENLFYVCVCSDGSRPNLTQYSETIPYYLCTLDQGDCIKNCGSDNTCADQCRKTYVCGATSPRKINATASGTKSSTSASASSTGVVSGDGFATTGTPRCRQRCCRRAAEARQRIRRRHRCGGYRRRCGSHRYVMASSSS